MQPEVISEVASEKLPVAAAGIVKCKSPNEPGLHGRQMTPVRSTKRGARDPACPDKFVHQLYTSVVPEMDLERMLRTQEDC